MADALEYALPTTHAVRPLWQRLFAVPMYYLGWTVGCGVASGYATAVTVQHWNPMWFGGTMAALIAGGAVGVPGGVTLAFIARRKRWPQVIIAVIGGLTALYLVYAVVDLLRSPPSLLSDLFIKLALFLLSGALGSLSGGIAGMVLMRQR